MQQAVMEENNAINNTYEDNNNYNENNYNNLFPALKTVTQSPKTNQVNNKMRLGSSQITQIIRIAFEERKFDQSEEFGEGEATRTCAMIMKETDAQIEITTSRDQSLTFLVTGKQTAVLEAKRKILTHFQTQAVRQLAIPVEHHRIILGKGGARHKELERSTSTKITIPHMNENSEIITISGTRENIEKAEHEIRCISDEQLRKGFERVPVPKIYHPFIVGPNNEYLNMLIEQFGVRINVPPASVDKEEIIIAGDKDGVMAAKDKIEQIHKKMQNECSTVTVDVPRSQHKYVVGPRGSKIAEILRETNVSVEIPSIDSQSDIVTLRGPRERIAEALDKVYKIVNSFLTDTIDAPAWIHKHIIGKGGANIKKMTQDYPKVQVEMLEQENKIRLEGQKDEVERLKREIEHTVSYCVNSMTFAEFKVDQKYCKFIIGKSGTNVNRLKDETNVTINIRENDDGTNTIRIEGPIEGVQKAQLELQEQIYKLKNEETKELYIDNKLYKTIIGPKGKKIREIRDEFNTVTILFRNQQSNDKSDVVTIRGPRDDVEKCAKYMQNLVKQLEEENYTRQVPIIKQFHKFIIGKGGVNIKKIRDETQTKIDLPAEDDKSDVIQITGRKENVDEAVERIQKIESELANIDQVEVAIPPKYYTSLIGSGGRLIHSIQDECGGNVQIKFPTDNINDKVIIRGEKEEVEKAQKKLLQLTEDLKLSDFKAEVRAKPEHHKILIGKNGANVKKIKEATGARIIFPSLNEGPDKDLITIIGRKEGVEKAKQMLLTKIKEMDNIVEKKIHIDPKHHRHFIVRRFEVSDQIQEEYDVNIIFPRPPAASSSSYSNDDYRQSPAPTQNVSDQVLIKGSKENVEKAIKRINEIILDLESRVTITCVIPQKHHRVIMGQKGSRVQNITQEFDVMIKFPEKSSGQNYNSMPNGDASNDNTPIPNGASQKDPNNEENVPACDKIRISGRKENVEKAKQALLAFVPIEDEINVPYELHGLIIGRNGRDVRDLMNKFDVHIHIPAAEEHSETIKITGPRSNVNQAKEAIDQRRKDLETEREDKIAQSFELKLEINPELHSKLIGKRGVVITKIRTDHNVQINFPKKGDPNEHIITIVGYESNANAAKDAIMKIVNNYNDMTKVEIEIDSRVHNRFIAFRGRRIKSIMDEYKVDIRFPRQNDPNPDLVVIMGQEENVDSCKYYLESLAEEFVQDINDREQYMVRSKKDNQKEQKPTDNGFVVKGAPWEQKAPDTESIFDFPSINSSRNYTPNKSNNTSILSSANSTPGMEKNDNAPVSTNVVVEPSTTINETNEKSKNNTTTPVAAANNGDMNNSSMSSMSNAWNNAWANRSRNN